MGNRETLRRQAEAIFRHDSLLSIKTRERYREACLRFADWLAGATDLQSFCELKADHVRRYAEAMLSEGRSAKTVKTDLSAIQFLRGALLLRGYVRAMERFPEPMEIGVPRVKRGPDRRWREEDLRRMITLARVEGKERYADMMELAWELGLRVHEVVRVDRAQCEPRALRGGKFRTIGKGGKPREVPLTPRAEELLEKYRRLTPRGKKIFVGEGETAGGVIAGVQRFIREHRGEAEPGYSLLTFHGLRYSYAQRQDRELAAAGKPKAEREKEISRRLGHNRREVTRTYVRD